MFATALAGFDERFGYPSQVRIDLYKGGDRDDEITLIASIKAIQPMKEVGREPGTRHG